VSDQRERDPVPPFADLVLRGSPNWTAVGFFGMLGGLHLTVAIPSLLEGRYGYVSLLVGSIFVTASLVSYRFRAEVAMLASQQRLRLRTGVGRLVYERSIPFASVRAVRLTTEPGARRRATDSLIELLCHHEDVACPPTVIPRQQALFLAMAMNVPLIKVSEEERPVPPAPARVEEQAPLRRP
jgi:hypothetical protein